MTIDTITGMVSVQRSVATLASCPLAMKQIDPAMMLAITSDQTIE